MSDYACFSSNGDPYLQVLSQLFRMFVDKTKKLDGKLISFKPKSKSDYDIGAEFIDAHFDLLHTEFTQWVLANEVAIFMVNPEGSFKIYMTLRSFSIIGSTSYLGARFKKLNPKFVRDGLPKDLKKSFATKATSLLPKIAEEINKENKSYQVYSSFTKTINNIFLGEKATISPKAAELKRIYEKYSEFEDLSAEVQDVLRQAAIISVTTS